MIFDEEAGGQDPLLGAMRARVRELTSASGHHVLDSEGVEEHFGAVISTSLLQLSEDAPSISINEVHLSSILKTFSIRTLTE